MKKQTQTILLWILTSLFIALGVFTIVGGIVTKTIWLALPCILSGGIDLIIAILIAGEAAGNKYIY